MAIEGNRGAVLLAELKALVDSLPHHQRAGVIKVIEITCKKLNADFPSNAFSRSTAAPRLAFRKEFHRS